MKKTRTKKGFTLAELLVVVAIIGVLVAIAIPTFTAQLKKAKIATDDANIRAAYAMMKTAELTGELEGDSSAIDVSAASTGDTYYLLPNGTVGAKGSKSGAYVLQSTHTPCSVPGIGANHTEGNIIGIKKAATDWTISIDSAQ